MIISFNEIIKSKTVKILNILCESEKYFAHQKKNKKELLSEHSNLTLRYFIRLCEANKLEPVIDKQIMKFTKKVNINNITSVNFIKELFIKTIIFHDLGKINENFQLQKMDNPIFSKVKNEIGSDHSILSAFLFFAINKKKIFDLNIEDDNKRLLISVLFLFTYPIIKHHGKITEGKNIDFREVKTQLKLVEYFKKINELDNIKGNEFTDFLTYKEEYIELIIGKESNFKLFSLIKLLSSLTTASDYYATNEFMIGLETNKFGILSNDLKDKLKRKIYEISYNRDLYDNINKYCSINFDEIQEVSEKNLNKLRQKLSANIIHNLEKNFDKRLFYIEAPTGSGKTNLSLLFIRELLNKRNDITKIFYVFPFTSLITQTFSSIKKSLNLTNSEIAELHSKTSYITEKDEEEYGSKKKNYIDYLFANYPMIIVSHIKFFNILTSNEKSSNYLLHRVANSIVIIDEIQSYTPTEWDKINYLITEFSELYNITFLIMSATLPKISKLLIDKNKENKDLFTYLVQNKSDFFHNPNFKNRLTFRFDYFNKKMDLEKLLEIVFEKSELYYKKHNFIKAIVEFVKKSSAHKFFEMVSASKNFEDYKKFIISGTILEPRRKEIIQILKSKKQNNDKIMVITTQVIEAGMDLDMDLGFKDKSIIDSEEQLAGRINRNASKTGCELYIINTGDSAQVYQKDLRYKLKIKNEEYLRLLENKEFDIYYDRVFDSINKSNEDIFLATNLPDFKMQISNLNFKKVKESFELIKSDTLSIFVPLKLKLKYFEKKEIIFLKQFNQNIDFNDNISGKNIWEIYTSLISNKEFDFIERKMDLKILSSIMSRFCFSLWKISKQYEILRFYSEYGEEKFGYLYLNDYQNIYSFNNGLSSNIDENINFIGF